ncbi:MAG TPA: hypothetical protein VGL69_07875 [Solirubrobacteraceae bacterium]|jgi:hypothetical protein
MIHRSRRLGVVILSIGCICLLAACGSSSKSSSGSSGAGAAGHFAGFKLTTTERACLKKKGVTLPTGGFRPGGAAGNFKGGPPNGKSPNGKSPTGKFPKGKFPKNGKFPKHGNRAAGFAAQNSKRLVAFKACGVSFPSRTAGGAPPSTTTG